MKKLKISEKWSIVYDPSNNDRPVGIERYGALRAEGWDQNNMVTAMFYEMLKTDKDWLDNYYCCSAMDGGQVVCGCKGITNREYLERYDG